MLPIIWLAIFLGLLLCEILTLNLTTIWFAAGAFVSFILAVLEANLIVQMIAFVLISFILLILTKPILKKFMDKDNLVKTNIDELPGSQAIVLEEINNMANTGKVMLRGMEWTARSMDNAKVIPKDSLVVVKEVQGVKLMVELQNK